MRFAIGGVIDYDAGDSSYTRIFNGYINDLRVVKGKALYTTDRFCEYEDHHTDCEPTASPTPTNTAAKLFVNPDTILVQRK